MFTDLVGSVDLKNRLGVHEYGKLLSRHDTLFLEILNNTEGARLQQDTGDGFYALFSNAITAVEAALRFQYALYMEPWGMEPPQVRIGLHLGQISELPGTDADSKLVGLPIDLTARLMKLAAGRQILMTRHVFDDARQHLRKHPQTRGGYIPALEWVAHGTYRLKGYEDPMEIFEVGSPEIALLSPPSDNEAAQRVVSNEEMELLGWRPASGLGVPQHKDWVLRDKLGEGSVGEVWVATHRQLDEQHIFKFCFDAEKLRSLKRELTLLKFIRKTLGDRHDISKLYDVQLEHPPYYIEGDFSEHGDLTTWMDTQGGVDRVPLETRLALLSKIAKAVAAAHSVGVLHKDLKPSNILIDVDENGPYPKLSDFGIGELTGKAHPDEAGVTVVGFTEMLTEHEHLTLSGTRLYTPPESLIGHPFTIQGDVYAMGVMLYQLVIGDLKNPLAPGWERDVKDELLREDIACCIDGEPSRRFSSALEIAERIDTLEQRRKAYELEQRRVAIEKKRKRITRLMVITTSILVVVVAAISVALVREQALRKETKLAHEATKQEAAKTKVVSQFLQDMFASVDPVQAQGRKVTVDEILGEASKRLDSPENPFEKQPLVDAAIRATLGATYYGLGEYVNAEPYLENAFSLRREILGENNSETLNSMNALGLLYWAQGRFEESETLLLQAWETSQELLGDDHLETLAIASNLGMLYDSKSELKTAESFYQKVLGSRLRLLGPEHPETLSSMLDLSFLYHNLGMYQEGERLARESFVKRQRIFGDLHPDTLTSMHTLALLLWDQQKYDESEPLMVEVIKRRKQVLGEEHNSTLLSINNLALLYYSRGQYEQAEPLFTQTLQIQLRKLGEEHPDTLYSRSNLANVYYHLGRYAEAEEQMVNVYEHRRRKLGEKHAATVQSMNNLGVFYRHQGEYDRAEMLLSKAVQLSSQEIGEEHPYTLRYVANLATVHMHQEKFEEAESRFKKILHYYRGTVGEQHQDTLKALHDLASLYIAWGKYENAEPFVLEYSHISSKMYGADSPETKKAKELQTKLYVAWGKTELQNM